MIGVVRIDDALISFLTRTARQDYYSEGGEPPGRWIGATSSFGVHGAVQTDDLISLTHRPPTVDEGGRHIAVNTDGGNRRDRGTCYVFYAPTSWSVLWAFCRERTRISMESAFDRAIERSVQEYIEPEIARCLRADGDEVTAKIVAAQFNHATDSRGRMNYHAFVVFPAVGMCSDREMHVLDPQQFCDRSADAAAYFRLALEHESSRFGLQFHRPVAENGLQLPHNEVMWIPDSICEHFRSPSPQFELGHVEQDVDAPEVPDVVDFDPHRNPEHDRPRRWLFGDFRREASAYELPLDWAEWFPVVDPAGCRVHQAAEYTRALEKATEGLTREHPYFDRKSIIRETLVASQGRGGVDPLRIYTWLKHDLGAGAHFVPLVATEGMQTFTTSRPLHQQRGVLEEEHAVRPARVSSFPENVGARTAKDHLFAAVDTQVLPTERGLDGISAKTTSPAIQANGQSRPTNVTSQTAATSVPINSPENRPAHKHGRGVDSVVEIKPEHRAKQRIPLPQVSRGKAEAVLEGYACSGNMQVATSRADAQQRLVADWAKNGGLKTPEDHAIMATNHAEVRQLNDLAQRERLRAREVSRWSSVTLGNETFYRGDRVLFIRSNSEVHVQNGDFGTIVSIRKNPLHASIKVRFDHDQTARDITVRTLLRGDQCSLRRGYATRVNRLQGRSVSHVYCLLSGVMPDTEKRYVCLSDDHRSLHIYAGERDAGVRLTRLAREATGDPTRIAPKRGLNHQISPLIGEPAITTSRTAATDQKTESSQVTMTLKLGG